ncbi:MAG: substrate-binding domain-containing protein [Acidimicrobiia bacterium]
MRRLVAGLALVVAGATLAGCGSDSAESFSLAAGTSVVDSGFIRELVSEYQVDHPDVEISVIGLSSAEAFAYARAYTVEAIITHDRVGLREYQDHDANAVSSVPFESSFVLVGPSTSSVRAPGTEFSSIVDAFGFIALSGQEFVSRDDGSGTNVRELEIWSEVPADPTAEEWYTRTGAGMGSTLQVADQRDAWILAELGTFLTAEPVLGISVQSLGSNEMLDNPYDLTVVGLHKGPALAFARWLSSEDGAAAIGRANDRLFGKPVYVVP